MAGGGPSWSSGVGPRRAENVCAITTLDNTARTIAAAGSRKFRAMAGSLSARDTDGALLEVGLKRYRIGSVERHLVDELAFVKPRHEYDAARHAVPSACLEPGSNGASPRLNFHLIPAAHIQLGRIVRMHETERIRKRAIKFGHSPRHRSGVPMLEHSAGHKPIGVSRVRRFRRRFVGQGKNSRLAVGETVKLDALARLYVRVEAFPVTPACFLAVDDRPSQPTDFVIRVEWCE